MADRSLDEILLSMESLEDKNFVPKDNSDNDDIFDEYNRELYGDRTQDRAVFDEFIPNHIAETLLGKDYTPRCKYKLISQPTSTVVVKIDPRIAADSKPVYDEHGNIVSAHMMEYELYEYNIDAALEIADTMRDRQEREMVGEVPSAMSTIRTPEDIPKVHKSKFPIVISMICIFMLLVWIAVMFFIYRFGGM